MQDRQLLQLMADGRFHSGEALGKVLGISRAAVWSRLKRLAALGLEVYSVRGRGYRLAEPLELLDAEKVLAFLQGDAAGLLADLQILFQTRSTNAFLCDSARDRPSGSAVLAESQSGGQGRRGRVWHSPLARNIYLSVLWRFDHGPAGLVGLALAMAVAVLRAVERVGAPSVEVKWPNDILWHGRKLAGILVDVAGEASGPTHAVVGVGLNWHMDERTELDQPWIDLQRINPEIGRNEAAGTLLGEILCALSQFQAKGLAPFLAEWREKDSCFGRPARVIMAHRQYEGIARGIDDQGMFRLQTKEGLKTFSGGEVSLRARGEQRDAAY